MRLQGDSVQGNGAGIDASSASTNLSAVPAESASAAETPAADDWAKAKIEYTVTADSYGRYVTDKANPMLVKSIVDVFGTQLTSDDYDVLYFQDNGKDAGVPDAGDTVVSNLSSDNGAFGGYPTVDGNYFIVVFKAGELDRLISANKWSDDFNGWTYHADIANAAQQTQLFRVSCASENPFEGAFAYEVGAEADDFSDVTFKFDGGNHKVAFAANGKKLVDAAQDGNAAAIATGEDYIVKWTEYAGAQAPKWNAAEGYYDEYVLQAGDYAATIYDNDGHQAVVEFTVDPIDLSKDAVTLPTVDTDYDDAVAKVYVNGEPVDTTSVSKIGDYLALEAVSYEDVSGKVTSYPTALNGKGIYSFKASAKELADGKANNNVVGGPVDVSGCIVTTAVEFTYGVDTFANAFASPFVVSTGVVFNPALIKADPATADFDYTVTKDGVEVETYTEPGEYVLTVDSPVTAGFKTGGHETATFTVVAAPAKNYTFYAQVDGKALSETFPYTGEAYVPTVAVVDEKGAKAVEGEDYTVRYELDGEAVESMVEADVYTVIVDYADERITDGEFQFTISKAPVVVAKADRYVHAYTGEAVAPTFTGNTKADWTGLSLALSADNAVVTYQKWAGKYVVDEATKQPTEKLDWTGATAVAAKDLKEVGVYKATVKVPASNKNFKDADDVATAVFEISKTAGFSDVAADAWYADDVYKAAELEYMKGIAEGIFAPENEMTRAEFAKLVFNMAGNTDKSGVEYPTQFTDVPANAWYAQAVEWAARYGIVNGTSETTFAPNETISREQIAAMFYRYAGNGAEADLSALDQFEDADQVSGWAKEAMAWAVENGYVNGVSDTALAPAETATRAQIAAIAVRVQPEAL